MSWPSASEYSEAFQALSTQIGDDELRRGELRTTPLGLPAACSGNFSSVYHIDVPATGASWAVKCFMRETPGLKNRYPKIVAHLKKAQLPFFIDCTWVDKGVRVAGTWYPFLKMRWIDGQNLDDFLAKHVNNPRTLGVLAEAWLRLAAKLREASIAHFDLQPANILLPRDPATGRVSVKLIDYDALWVPELAGNPPCEAGHPCFQHPRLAIERHFGPEVDAFAHLTLYTTLRCLAAGGAALWQKHGDDERLLFRRQDFIAPERSALFRDLWRLSDPEARALAGHLMLAIQGPARDVPRLDQIVIDRKVTPLSAAQEEQIERALNEGAWPQSYSAEISRNHPTCVVIVASQTLASEPATVRAGAATIADWVNDVLAKISLRCVRHTSVHDRFHLGLVRYADAVTQGFDGALAGQSLVPIIQLAQNPLRVETREKKVDDGAGGIITTTARAPIWIETAATSQGSTMCAALDTARTLVAGFIREHPDAYPPLVLHLTTGESTDGDPTAAARALCKLTTNDGNVLLFNACLAALDAEVVQFPESAAQLPNGPPRLLFELSSVLPPPMRASARAESFALGQNARGFVLNRNLDAVIRFYQLGTQLSAAAQPGEDARTGSPVPEPPPAPKPLVFISAKSEDYGHARAYYDFLTARGLRVFLSCESLKQQGKSDYRAAIDEALDEALHMIIVTSSPDNVRSNWVEAEWGLFVNEKRSGRKTGNLLTVTAGSMTIAGLPASLRYYEVIPSGPEAFERVFDYVGR